MNIDRPISRVERDRIRKTRTDKRRLQKLRFFKGLSLEKGEGFLKFQNDTLKIRENKHGIKRQKKAF